jgi:hypothetical protein
MIHAPDSDLKLFMFLVLQAGIGQYTVVPLVIGLCEDSTEAFGY